MTTKNETVKAPNGEITNLRYVTGKDGNAYAVRITKPIVGYCALCGRALSRGQYRRTDVFIGGGPRIICRARGLCAQCQEQQRKERT